MQTLSDFFLLESYANSRLFRPHILLSVFVVLGFLIFFLLLKKERKRRNRLDGSAWIALIAKSLYFLVSAIFAFLAADYLFMGIVVSGINILFGGEDPLIGFNFIARPFLVSASIASIGFFVFLRGFKR